MKINIQIKIDKKNNLNNLKKNKNQQNQDFTTSKDPSMIGKMILILIVIEITIIETRSQRNLLIFRKKKENLRKEF